MIPHAQHLRAAANLLSSLGGGGAGVLLDMAAEELDAIEEALPPGDGSLAERVARLVRANALLLESKEAWEAADADVKNL